MNYKTCVLNNLNANQYFIECLGKCEYEVHVQVNGRVYTQGVNRRELQRELQGKIFKQPDGENSKSPTEVSILAVAKKKFEKVKAEQFDKKIPHTINLLRSGNLIVNKEMRVKLTYSISFRVHRINMFRSLFDRILGRVNTTIKDVDGNSIQLTINLKSLYKRLKVSDKDVTTFQDKEVHVRTLIKVLFKQMNDPAKQIEAEGYLFPLLNRYTFRM